MTDTALLLLAETTRSLHSKDLNLSGLCWPRSKLFKSPRPKSTVNNGFRVNSEVEHGGDDKEPAIIGFSGLQGSEKLPTAFGLEGKKER